MMDAPPADLVLGVVLAVGYGYAGWRAEKRGRESEFFALWWFAAAAATALTTALWAARGSLGDDALLAALALAAILAFGVAVAALASGLLATVRNQTWLLWSLLASCAITFALFAGGAWLGLPGGFLGLLLMPMLLGAITHALIAATGTPEAERRIRWH